MSDMPSVIDFSVDISKAEAPPLLPVGEYRATIKAAEAKVSANSGNTYASVTFNVDPDQFPADYDASIYPTGKTMAYNRVLLEDNPTANFRLRKFLEAIQAKGGKSINLNDWVGLEAVIEVDHSTFEDEDREEIKRVKML